MDDLSISFLVVPFLITLILTGIHVYLGLHVLSRGIIFVDLALAQMAALGTTVGFLAGFEPDGSQAYFCALGFTLFGAVLFAATRSLAGRIPQEAIIGIVYAVASAAVILAVDRAPHGAEHIKSLLVRDILWVQDWSVVVKLAGIYGALGLVHFLCRRRLLQASMSPESIPGGRGGLFLWDLLFYVTFGVVVTSSVQVAGVLLVFSYLMVPAVMGALLFSSVTARLLFGWGAGFVVSILGLFASFKWDLPTGSALVVTFGLVLAFLAAIRWLVLVASRAKSRA